MCNTGFCKHERAGQGHCTEIDIIPCLTEDTMTADRMPPPIPHGKCTECGRIDYITRKTVCGKCAPTA
jgi:hypothetical protein